MSDVPSISPGLSQIAYNEAIRAIGKQQDSLGQLRTRTGTLISAASIANSFLGSTAAQGRHGFPLVFLWAVIPFGLSILLTLYLLAPRPGWTFSLRTDNLRAYGDLDLASLEWLIATEHEKNTERNDLRMRTLSVLFGIASLSLLWSIIAWLAIIE